MRKPKKGYRGSSSGISNGVSNAVRLKSEKSVMGSSGLGLTFCKMAVEAHGEKIWVESEGEGKGCAFFVSIPIEAVPPE